MFTFPFNIIHATSEKMKTFQCEETQWLPVLPTACGADSLLPRLDGSELRILRPHLESITDESILWCLFIFDSQHCSALLQTKHDSLCLLRIKNTNKFWSLFFSEILILGPGPGYDILSNNFFI